MANELKTFVKTFKPSKSLIKPDHETVNQFENILPRELIGFWKLC